MKSFKFILILLGMAFFPLQRANAIQCKTATGFPHTYNFNFNINSTSNYVGYQTNWNQQSRLGAWQVNQWICSPSRSFYYSALPGPDLRYSHNEGGIPWFDILGNDYIQVSSQIGIYNALFSVNNYYSVPFRDISNQCSENGYCGADAPSVSGSKAKVKFRIKRKFIGNVTLRGMRLFSLHGNNRPGENAGDPLVVGDFSMSISIPQKCEINAGEILTFDFGNIPSSGFNQAGIKPDNLTPLTRTVSVKCNGIEPSTNLTMRVEANNVMQNAIVSDNKDLGFVITDKNNRPFTPNNRPSNTPLRLDENSTANVTIKAYPVSITGKPPREGVVTSLAYLRLDFD